MTCLKEDTISLLKRYKLGEENVKNIIIEKNLPLVYSLINKYRHTNTDKNDLFQIGCLGLIKAIENFNPLFNVQFSTYAVPLILGEIKKHFRDYGLIKVSRSLKELSIAMNKIKNDYYTKNGSEITIEELANTLNVSKYDIIMALETSYIPASFEDTIYDKDGSTITFAESLRDEKKSNLIDLLTLEESINTLTEKEKIFVKLRFYQELNQQTIAQKFNVSQVQISRFEKRIIEKLRKLFQ